jgi:predicted phosphodiesterase
LVKKILELFEDARNLFLTAGNHDYFSYNGNGFFECKECKKNFDKEILNNVEMFPDVTITTQNLAFIGLNSAHADFFARGKIGEKQLERLKIVLNQESIKRARFRIIYLHHHSIDKNIKWYNFWSRFMKKAMELKDSKSFLKVIRQGGVEMVLNGHKHSRLGSFIKHNIMFFNGGSSSGVDSRKGISLITIDRNNQVQYEARWNFYEE